MGNNDFMLDIIAKLNKQLSKAQLKSDLKGIDNTLSVKVIAKLATALSKKQLRESLKQLNNLYVQVGTKFKTDKNTKNKLLNEIGQLQKKLTELQLKVNVEKGASQKAISSVISTAKMAQRYADKTSITLDVEVRKEKVVNDILYIGQKYSKLFSNISASRKYENLLNSAYSISDKSQLQEVKTQISAFISELKASGLAAESTGQKWRKLLDRAKELFSAASVIRTIFVQAKQAVSTTIGLDKVYTDLVKVNDELNRNDYADYLSKCNQKAQELATTQKALIEGATEFSKSGYDLSTSNAMTEKSTILANVGEMTASDSAKAIISGVQAYDVVDGYTDVVDKAQALIDKYNEIGNTASITTAEIAQGVQKVGSVFADANTSVDELIALGAAGNRQYQDADSLFLGLRTAALRIRGCSAELEAMGEETEGVYTSASKLAEKIEGLTNVNGTGGVKILEDDEETFRSIYDIFLDISKVYKDMSDTDASALLELIAGKNRASAISATLNNMTEAQEILQNSLNAAGSAQKEYNTYLESTEAHIQQFQAKLVETYSTLNGNMISHAADLGTAILDLVNKTDLLKHSLIAITTLKVGHGIAAVGGAISGTVTQMNTLGNALQQIKSLPLDDDLRKEVLDDIGEATKSLTEKNLKLLLSQKQLIEDDRTAILVKHNLTEEEALSKLEKMGLTAATNANTAANTSNVASTNALKGAFTGLTASVKATWAAMSALQKASIIFAAVSTAWSIGSSIINGIKQDNENLRQATQESANAYKESASSIEDYASRYEELHEALLEAKGDEEETYNIKRRLLDLQTELNSKYGEEYGNVNLVTDAYNLQIEAIRALNEEKAQTFLNENREGITDATEEMTEQRHYNLSYTGMSSYTDEGAALKEIAEKYAEQGIYLQDELGDGSFAQFSIHLEADAQSAYDTINAFETDVSNKAIELGDKHMFDDVLEISSVELNNAKETIDQYGDTYRQALTAEIASDDSKSKVYGEALQAVEAYNEAVLRSEDPYNDDNVLEAKENLDAVKESIQGNEEEWGKYSAITDDAFAQADTRVLDFNEKLKNDSGLQALANDLNGLSNIDLEALDQNVGDNESFDKLKVSAEEYNISVDELIDTLVRLGYVQEKVQDSTPNIESPISFDQAWADSFTSENEKVKELGNTLLELAEKGRLTVDTFNEADSTGYFKNIDISADEAVSRINKLVDESKQLSSMSSQISKMSEALATKKSNGFVEADTLSGFDVEVRGLESWDKFQAVLGSTTSSYEECQEAANELATEWVNSSDFLAQLTEDTKEYYETQLEAMGVENYEEVIESTLALKEAKEALIDVDLSETTSEEIQNLIDENGYLGETADAIWALYNAKIAEEATTINTSADCQNLIDLCGDTDKTSHAVELLIELMDLYNMMEGDTYKTNGTVQDFVAQKVDEIKRELEGLAESEESATKPQTKVRGGSGKKSGGSKSSKDKHKEAYDAELKELERMHKLGLISDEEYWKARIDLNEKYFGESSGMHEKYLEEYQDNEEDILEGIKKLWEDYYDERKNNLKDLISYAEKLYDKEIDSYESSIKVLEEKRDAEKKYWQDQIDAIGDEVDALEDANDERQRAIDLQQKQWNLQKAMHQRVILLYSETKGMHYVNDTKAERDAKNDLDNAEHDNKVADLKKQQEDLEKQLDAILETYDSQIEAIEKQIDGLKEVKTAWSDIVENQEFKELEERLKSLFGNDFKDKILSGNTDFINSIISQYSDTSDILRTIEDATLADIRDMVAQYGVLPENLMPITDAIADITNVMGTVDTSGFNANLDSTAQSSSNAAEKVQGVTTALNNLSNDVSNYQLPELNTENFMSAFSEEGGILSALNGFMERYREICAGIPEIWNNSLAEAFGQGGGNADPLAGGLPNDRKYNVLFDPLIDALNNCRTNMETKLKECLGVFSTFQADLSGVIGISGGTEDSGAPQSGTEGGKGKGAGSDRKSESGSGSDTIVGAIVEGGKQIDKALNGEEDSWSASFIDAAGSIHNTADYIVECIESMVETIVDACISAIEAINMLEQAEGGSGNHPAPVPYIRIGHGHGEIGDAHVEGTAKVMGDWSVQSNENKALVGEVGREIIVRNGKYFTVGDDGAEMFPIKKGDIVFNHEQTEALLKNGHISGHGKAYADGTVGGGKLLHPDGRISSPLQPGTKLYDLIQKANVYFGNIDQNVEKLVPNSFYENNEKMHEAANQISNISNITNNNRNVPVTVNQNITLNCPNLTNNSGVEYVQKQLGHLSQRAYQEPLRDY